MAKLLGTISKEHFVYVSEMQAAWQNCYVSCCGTGMSLFFNSEVVPLTDRFPFFFFFSPWGQTGRSPEPSFSSPNCSFFMLANKSFDPSEQTLLFFFCYCCLECHCELNYWNIKHLYELQWTKQPHIRNRYKWNRQKLQSISSLWCGGLGLFFNSHDVRAAV